LSIIEQAAKRLEQLRRSGIEVRTSTIGHDSIDAPAGLTQEPTPLRAVRELRARAAALDATGGAASNTAGGKADLTASDQSSAAQPDRTMVRPAPEIDSASGVRLEIDFARLSANGYITPHAQRSQLAEQFRVVKGPLLVNVRGKAAAPVINANRLMVTSSLPGEGKTFVAVNLAMSLVSEVDTHVLLVDADTSRPAVLSRLGVEAEKGLLDLLLDPALPLGSVIMSTNVERLSILPAGTPHGNATELLASEAMGRLVERLASTDPRLVLLFDTPPLLAASEARVLAAHMGQVILVVAANDTPQGTVLKGLEALENCPVVMTLLNRGSSTEATGYYGSYGPYA
jgi:protein-tyrosine kinase